MDIVNHIIYAILVLGGLGLIFGLALAYASKIFAVQTDERLEPVTEALPGANCGGCGFSGCADLARAILEGRAGINACVVGRAAVVEKLAVILGVSELAPIRQVALVRCSGGTRTKKRFEYTGMRNCLAASSVGGRGPSACDYGCLGFGDCAAVCRFEALRVTDGVAAVDQEKCTGCMQCASVCPRRIIVRVPYEADINIACSSHEKGSVLRTICEIGCLGCKICESVCPLGAIHVVNNLARINHEKCNSCGLCVRKCPRKLISDSNLNREHEIPDETSASASA